MRRTIVIFLIFSSLFLGAKEREYIWPKGKMPDFQGHQIAAMSAESESGREDFNPDDYRQPYLDWFEAPDESGKKGVCMIVISGGSYNHCVSRQYLEDWQKQFTSMGIQCVNFVYRTPRPVGIPYYQTAWEDGQRAVRVVRSEAKKRGYDPEKIGVISMSAGSHLALLLATSSQTPAYEPVDKIDKIPCHINWAISFAPAYLTSDAVGTPASKDGYGPDVKLVDEFRFDEKTCPVSLHHGGIDIYSPNGSTLFYRRLRQMGVPAELHLYPNVGHGVFGFERGVEFMRQMGFLGPVAPQEKIMERFQEDLPGVAIIEESIWPEGKMPDPQSDQCEPYIKWYIPEKLNTKAIQIIYSGGSYVNNYPVDHEVAPARKYLNERGIAVVVLRYRTPRPVTGLAKHTSAWQDLQRAIRVVRAEAESKGLDPGRIGIMGSSAGGHLTMLGVTSSRHKSYYPIDVIDKIPCNVQWGIAVYPAYLLTDGLDGHNTTGGNEDSAVLAPEFSFDLDTAPTLFLHGDADGYSAMGSVKAWEKMRSMGVQCELHTLASRSHCFQREASPGTGSYTWLDRIGEFLEPFIGN